MTIATSLKEFLASHPLRYETIKHDHAESGSRSASAAHLSGDAVAKAVLLKQGERYLLAVLPATHRLDFGRLHRQFSHHIGLATESEAAEIFNDCAVGAIPPTGLLYNIETVVDESLLSQADIYFEAGDHEHLIHMRREDFSKLLGDATKLQMSHHI
jgi:Ala-tRNA(Pro) deacylase